MEAIKKKLQAMKLERENALDRADEAESAKRESETKALQVTEMIHLQLFLVIFVNLLLYIILLQGQLVNRSVAKTFTVLF